jgi:predicted thioesterase
MEKMPEYKVGMSAVIQKRIEESDTARGMGRDSLETLLATPTYVDLMIRAAIEVLKPNFPYQSGFITVGTAMTFNHQAPSALGMTVSVKATLTKIDGNRFYFDIEAFDEVGVIGRGTHERQMVKLQGLLDKVRERTAALAHHIK